MLPQTQQKHCCWSLTWQPCCHDARKYANLDVVWHVFMVVSVVCNKSSVFLCMFKKKKKNSIDGVKMVVPLHSHSHLCDIQSDKIHHNIKFKNLTKPVSIRVHTCYIGGAGVHKSFGGTVSELNFPDVWLGRYELHRDSASKDEPR